MPKLTIAIPNYNGGENLRRSIESCRTIQIPENNYEILIVDNKSTDNSIDIVNEMKKKFTNIRLVENEKNIGRIQNWNVSIEKALGRYLIFLFSNDLSIIRERDVLNLIGNETKEKNKMKYGGDTSCVEIRTKSNEMIILDMGTGLSNVGRMILNNPDSPKIINIFLTKNEHITHTPKV